MGRPREIQEDGVVTDALQMFWKQGYRATSIPDLLGATGLERGGLGVLGAVNAMVELGPFDPEVRARLARPWSIVEAALEQTLAESQRTLEVRNDVSAKGLAQMIV